MLHDLMGKKIMESYFSQDSDAKKFYDCYQLCQTIRKDIDSFIGSKDWEKFYETMPSYSWSLIISRELNSFIFTRMENGLIEKLLDLGDECMENLRYDYDYSNLKRELNIGTKRIKKTLNLIYDTTNDKPSIENNTHLFTFQNA